MNKHMLVYVAGAVILVLAVSCVAYWQYTKNSVAGGSGDYVRLRYVKGQPLPVYDLTLKYTGTTTLPPPTFNPNLKFVHYNFKITSKDGTSREIHWSSGTGSIGPTDFLVGTHSYSLERVASEKLPGKSLADDEVVVSRRADAFRVLSNWLRTADSPDVSVDWLSNSLGITFKKEEALSDSSYTVYTSDGFNPVAHAEIRINNVDPTNRIVIFDIDPALAITHSNVLDRYPDATFVVNPAGASERDYYEVKSNSGVTRYGFNADGRLVSIVYDSTQTK